MKFTIQKSLRILENTPEIIETLLSGLDEEWLYANEGDNTWNPFDVVGHLIEGEKTDWIPRLQIIVGNSKDRKFVPFDRFKQQNVNRGVPISTLIAEFRECRKKSLDFLKSISITEELLARTGIHPEFGEVNLKQLLATWVTHDLAHLSQITRIMAKQYKEEIGPWQAYFNIFKS